MQPSQDPHQSLASVAPPPSLAKRTTGAAGTSAASRNPSLHNTRAAAKAGRALTATESETPAARSPLGDKGKEREDANADPTAQATPVPPTSDSTVQVAPVSPTPTQPPQAPTNMLGLVSISHQSPKIHYFPYTLWTYQLLIKSLVCMRYVSSMG
ncbi:hypothetical protein B9479_008305 [Cryptococcus floricola]|uniref:Uncharacterized protein n=1 Tax=Cryptococcus floricola TaxID=2591691 RepID=A0A5D3AMD0_9TREE|nr:hypothetical protein B9479_008305 [Cryptococcus floricola]